MEYFLYFFLFVTLYFEILLLVGFFQREEQGYTQQKELDDRDYLSTTIIVPCYNEENTVQRTLDSLLALDFPADKLTIMAVDDGSTDGTWEALQKYRNYPQVLLLQKENEGSKFAALNFALKHIETELVGVLDADSWVDKDALTHYMEFFADKEVMATIPSMLIAEPDSFLRRAQKAEYDVGLFGRKSFVHMNSLFITPGPFSVFRKQVFDTLGPYKEAHHTEDAEIALRMQKHGYKIAYSEKSIVYTVGPKTAKPLIKQRVRWTYGFLRNVIDYREMLFNPKYKTLGMIVLPVSMFRVFITVFLFPLTMYLILMPLIRFIDRVMVVGWSPSLELGIDWYFVNVTQLHLFSFITAVLLFVTLWLGRDLVGNKRKITIDILYMLLMYTFLSPIWLIQSSWNALWAKKSSWR